MEICLFKIELVFYEICQFVLFVVFEKMVVIFGMLVYCVFVVEVEQDYEGFWVCFVCEGFMWYKLFMKVFDECNVLFYIWFDDGELNVLYNCFDCYVEVGYGECVVVIFEVDDGIVICVIYVDFFVCVLCFVNVLKKCGIGKGDCVVIYILMLIEGIVVMQVCVCIGVIYLVVFGGFFVKLLNEWFVDVGVVVLIIVDEQVCGGKMLLFKSIVDEVIVLGGCEVVKSVIVYCCIGGKIDWYVGCDLWMYELVDGEFDCCELIWVGVEYLLFILYMLGLIGKLKGVQYSMGGYLLWVVQMMKWIFDWKFDDVFWCMVDIGWVIGYMYIIYGLFVCGGMQVVFEGVLMYLDVGCFWKMIGDYKVIVFYIVLIVICLLIKVVEVDDKVYLKSYDLLSLCIIGMVGELINLEVWMWYYKYVGYECCLIVDMWWQIEIGGYMIMLLLGVMLIVLGLCMLLLLGIMVVVVDEMGQDVLNG